MAIVVEKYADVPIGCNACGKRCASPDEIYEVQVSANGNHWLGVRLCTNCLDELKDAIEVVR